MAVKIKPLFFWWEWVKKTIWDPFWWIVLLLVILWAPFLRVWWWIFLPLMLVSQLKVLYIWWLDWDFAYGKTKWVMLEMIPPKEILVPLKAMEDVFTTIWPIWDGANWRGRWFDGELDNAPYWCSFELASLEGKVHFYLRATKQHRTMIETVLYSHYPDMEIHEVPDYVKLVPQNAPNEEWDVYGEDFILDKPAALPIKTYEKFFEPQGERISAEEKRMDPIISLMEGMSKIGPGENYWVQFILIPVNDQDEPEWRKEGQKIINKISKRPEKKEKTFFEELAEVFSQIIMGPKKEGEGESAKYSWAYEEDEETGERQISLTPGEREIITEIDNKMKKPVYRTVLRAVYVAKRENWKSPNRVLMRSYLSHFTTTNMNFMHFDPRTRSKVHYIFRKRRVFLRARKIFRMAVLRFTPMFPDRKEACAILSSEELAGLFHFPLRTTGMVGPTMEKVESRKAGPPPNLPIE